MATPNQIRANRANALRSTGPTTPEGKQTASRNSTRHGLLSQTVVLEGESKSRFEDLLASFIAQFKPRSAAEAAIIETMAIARWKQMRIWGIQKAGFDLEMARLNSSCNVPATRASMVFKNLADNSRVLDLQHRYETGYDRQFCRAYAFFLKLREKNPTRNSKTQISRFTQLSAATRKLGVPHTEEIGMQPQPTVETTGKKFRKKIGTSLPIKPPPEPAPIPSEITQTAAIASAQHVLRNGPNSAPLSVPYPAKSHGRKRAETPHTQCDIL